MKNLDSESTIVIVGGCGHVGLPLGLALNDSGFNVVALDISNDSVNSVNSGVMPFLEESADELLFRALKSKKFRATSDHSAIAAADVVIVVIGTPVDEHLNPDPNAVGNAILPCIPFMNSEQLVVLRSTVFPGVTARVTRLLHAHQITPSVTFCPERILEGHALKELRELPQIIGASEDRGKKLATQLFNALGVDTIEVSPEEAELAKLFTNVWRYIKFAAANQFWMMSNDSGLDFTKIRNAVTFSYPRASDLPNAGFSAGPCLFKDTMQLAAFSNNNFALGHSAMLVNEGLPLYLVNRIQEKYSLNSLKVGILGMAFKGESDDTRSSLSYKLKKVLLFKAAQVICSDPFVTTDSNLVSQNQLLSESDLIIIGAPHSAYAEIKSEKPIIDIWNITGNGNLV